MKIAIFTDTFLPNIDGVSIFISNLSKMLAKKGHKIYIIAPKYNEKESFFYPNIKIFRVKALSLFSYKEYKLANLLDIKILNELNKERIDIIHCNSPASIGIFGVITAKILRIPLIGTFHTFLGDPQYLKHIKMNNKSAQKLIWTLQRAYYNKCDLITAPSETTKQELLEHNFKKPIKILSHGIDPAIFKNDEWKKIKKKYNQEGDIILFIGRIGHEKNIFYLLECFKMVLKKIPSLKLMIIGSGPQLNEVKQKINELDIDKNVILMGMIPHEELVKSSIFKACKLFVTASKTENLPLTLLEAQINGLVCIGLNKRGLKDLIKNNYNGYLIEDENKEEFAEKIIKLLKNKKLYNKMKKNTKKLINKHDINKVVDTWENEYHRLIINKRTKR